MFSDGDTSEPTVVTLWLCRSVDMFVMLLLSLASIFIIFRGLICCFCVSSIYWLYRMLKISCC